MNIPNKNTKCDTDTMLLIDSDSTKSALASEEQSYSNTSFLKIMTALFYAVASFLITCVNKTVLTSYKFPSFQFLAFGQMCATVIVLFLAKKLGYVNFPNFQLKVFHKIMPLPFIYVGNMVTGLGSTKKLSLPMFTMLRRISIFMTMVGEFYVLHVIPSYKVQLSVFLMIFGTIIAALEDLGFNFYGYVYVLLNDFFTASNNIIMKQKMDARSDIGKYGLMFYSALAMLPFSIFFMYITHDFEKVLNFNMWTHIPFLMQFLLSCLMGFILMYSVILCTQFNSALTTTIIGSLKNILITYIGMFIGGDYIYSFENVIGINISIVGSILYTWVTFKPPKKISANSETI